MIIPPRTYTAYELEKIKKILFWLIPGKSSEFQGLLPQFQTLDKALV